MFQTPNLAPKKLSPLATAIGSAIAMGSLFWVSQSFTGHAPNELLVASMGASAVLMFCVPHGELSGPWAVFGGHIASAIIGVTASLLIPTTAVAGVMAVSLAIFVMQLLKCLHPPGGATALSAVVGGGGVSIGYNYVLTPVLLNVLIMLTVAYLFHLPGRRYPLPSTAHRMLRAVQGMFSIQKEVLLSEEEELQAEG